MLVVHPELDSAYERRARVRGRQGDVEREVSDLDRALELNPNRASCYLRRARALTQHRGRVREGEADLREVLDRFPDWSEEYMEAAGLLGN